MTTLLNIKFLYNATPAGTSYANVRFEKSLVTLNVKIR